MVSSSIPFPRGLTVPASTPAVTQPVAAEKVKPYPWIVHPTVDFFLVYGGALWLLFGLQYYFFGWAEVNPNGEYGCVARWMILASCFGQHLFADSHTVATYVRIYATPESRKRFHLYAYYMPFISFSLLALCLTNPAAAGTCVYIHIMWVYQHYVGQCFGISLIYCYKRGYFLNPLERETFRWAMHSLSFFVISRMLCVSEHSPRDYWGVILPFWGWPLWIHQASTYFLGIMTVMLVATIVRKYHRDKQLIPLPAICLVLTVAGIGATAGYANIMVWAFAPPLFHGSQYLAVSLGYYLKDKGLDHGLKPSKIMQEMVSLLGLKYWAIVIVSGCFIYIVVPHFFEHFGLQFTVVSSIIQACINFHHFVSDAAIWRLRDAKCREVLLA